MQSTNASLAQNIITTDYERKDERFSLPLFVLLVFVRSRQPAFCSPPVLDKEFPEKYERRSEAEYRYIVVKEFPEKYDKQSEADYRNVVVKEFPGKYKTRVNEFV